VPFAVSTLEYTRKLQAALHPGGVVLVNTVGANTPECSPILGALHSTYQAAFPHYKAYPLQDTTLLSVQNIIVAYAPRTMPWLPENKISAPLPKGQILRDNFAPVERLQSNCKALTT